MDIQLDAPVVSADGTELGKINKVVFDPQSGETKSIVIHTGGLMGREVAAPTEAVRVAAASRVELEWTKEAFDQQPNFVADDYRFPPETWIAPYGWPSGGVLWPAGYLPGTYVQVQAGQMSDEVQQQLRERDMNNAVIGQGAEVLAIDGEKVGSVDNVIIDPVSHKPSSVVVKRGFLFTEDVELPGDWVSGYDDRQVTLNVDKVTVEQLAKRRH